MEQDTITTDVIFRKFRDGQIIALFPYETQNIPYHCMSYMHLGQHGEATLAIINDCTKLASIIEYVDLESELISLGYKLRILKKLSWRKHINLYYKKQDKKSNYL